jgi:hypothetical protein
MPFLLLSPLAMYVKPDSRVSTSFLNELELPRHSKRAVELVRCLEIEAMLTL